VIRRLAIFLVLAAVLCACVGHARTTGAYRGKASNSAKQAISSLQTALLAVQISEKGNMLGPYLETVLGQAEDDFGSVQEQFDSIQPPNTAEADKLRDTLDSLLSDGSDTLSQLRILSRRADEHGLVQTAADIPKLVDKLNAFQQATS
jgi:hypothetical protein